MRRKIALFILVLILVVLIVGVVVVLLSRQTGQPATPTETPAAAAASVTPVVTVAPVITSTPTVVAAAPTDTAAPATEAGVEVPALATDTLVPPTSTAIPPAETASPTPEISPTPADTLTNTPWPTFTRSPTPRPVVPALTLTLTRIYPTFPTFTPVFTKTATPSPIPSLTPTVTPSVTVAPIEQVFTPWPTFTRSPTPLPVTPTLTFTPPPFTATSIPPAATEVADARVKPGVTGLNLRDNPGLGANVVGFLAENTPMTVVGRTASNDWVQVIANGQTGWVSTGFVDVNVNLGGIAVTGEVVVIIPTNTAVAIVPTFTPVPFVPTFTPIPVQPTATFTSVPVVPSSPYVSGIGGRAREIYNTGQQLGNRANVFSKVGDSLTVATYVLYPIGWGMGNLQDYGYLSGVVNYFSAVTARDSNSFSNASLAADNGWTTANVLDPNKANPGICQAGETPLDCEYRVVKPSVAIIQLGTNDIAAMSSGEYNNNLRTIVDKTIARGIVPVLFTIPDRLGFSGQANEFNNIIINTANSYGIPLVNYGQAMRNLPNGGLSGDGVHPSWPPGHFSESTNLTAANLQYGYTMRNLVILQVLDALWRQVIS